MKSISIFGCTGSIGTQALEIIRQNKEQFSFDVFVCNSNTDKALEIVNEFNPSIYLCQMQLLQINLKNHFLRELMYLKISAML